ncbi:MAG: hypothetical protein WDZ62_02340 [Candidatus Pacearchaeota archaeon]
MVIVGIEKIVDKVILEYINAPAADYEIRINREHGDDTIDVMSYLVDNPKEAALKLLEYNSECIIAMNTSNNGFNKDENKLRHSTYFGAGSEKGRWKDHWMTEWEFYSQAELTKSDRKILEGIVDMRNCHVLSLYEIEKLRTHLETN